MQLVISLFLLCAFTCEVPLYKSTLVSFEMEKEEERMLKLRYAAGKNRKSEISVTLCDTMLVTEMRRA